MGLSMDESQRLHELVTELSEISIAPRVDYTVEGLRVLAASLLEARAFSERAAAIQSEAMGLVASMRASLALAEAAYQERYDEIVATDHVKYSSLSWEERASLYRTKTIEATRSIRKFKGMMIEIEVRAQQIEVLARSLYRARGDLQAVVQTMRAGEALGELARERDE